MNVTLKAALFGFIGGSALLIGALAGLYLKIPKRVTATIMAFGAGTMICTLAFELMEEAYQKGGFDSVTVGFLVGAILFVVLDWAVNRFGGHHRKDVLAKRYHEKNPEEHREVSGMAIFIGAVLDGIPESVAIGIGLAVGKGFGAIMVIAVFLSNLPEGISGAKSMKDIGKSKTFILSMWVGVTVVCTLSAILGYSLLGHGNPDLIASILALAAGAILAMVTTTMIPEAFDDEGRIAGLATVAGFLLSFILSRLTK